MSRIEGKYLISFNCKLKKDPKLGGHGIKLLNIYLPHPPPKMLYFKVQSTFIVSKAELPKVGIFFRTQFPSLGIFINKKVGNGQN